jgi:hypothetical protein
MALSSFTSAVEQDNVRLLPIRASMLPEHRRLTMSSYQVLYAQTRTTILVAKVSVAALWCLITANLLFVLTGAILLPVALYARGEGIDDVQARLSIAGLVAERFEHSIRGRPVEQIEELFDEYHGAGTTRVAIARAREGGYVYEET